MRRHGLARDRYECGTSSASRLSTMASKAARSASKVAGGECPLPRAIAGILRQPSTDGSPSRSPVPPTTAVQPQAHPSMFGLMRNRVAMWLVALVLASCASPPASSVAPSSAPASASPSATAAETPSLAPTPSEPDASPSPTTAALVVPDIEAGDYLEVTGNGLAVRAGPGAHHPLVSEYSLGSEDSSEITQLREEVRLPAGHVVRAGLGPLVVDDTVWWAVDNVPQAGQASTDAAPVWRSVAPVEHSELDFQLTWIAVAQPGVTLVRVTDQPAACPCYGDPPGPSAFATGVGEGRVGPWINRAPAWMTFAAAAPSPSGTCEFRVVNQDGQPMFFDEAAVDYLDGLIPGVSPAPEAGADAGVWLDIAGDCVWVVSVQLPQG